VCNLAVQVLSAALEQRDAVLQEATAIGTTTLRARLLPAPSSTESLKLLHEYLQIRLDLAAHGPSTEEMAAATCAL